MNPRVSLDEQNAFIDNLRNLQAQDNAQIAQQTKGLGTQVPSNLGGLTGGSGYFKARYQTPQTNQAISELKTVAQAQALSGILQNELEKQKASYYKAKRNYAEKASSGSGSSGSSLNDLLAKMFGDGSGDKRSGDYAGSDEIVDESKLSDLGWSNKDWDRKVAESGGQYTDEWYIPDWIERWYQTGENYLGNQPGLDPDTGWSNSAWNKAVEESNGVYNDSILPDWLDRGMQTGEWYFGNNKGRG